MQAARDALAQSKSNGAALSEMKTTLAGMSAGGGGTVDVTALAEALRPVVAEELAKLKLTTTP